MRGSLSFADSDVARSSKAGLLEYRKQGMTAERGAGRWYAVEEWRVWLRWELWKEVIREGFVSQGERRGGDYSSLGWWTRKTGNAEQDVK